MKIQVPASELGLDAFADLYRLAGDAPGPVPLCVWVGGAIDLEVYDERRSSEPLPVLAELETARARLGNPACDALLLSAPPTLIEMPEPARRHERFAHHLDAELLPRLPLPRPAAIALVGNSFGGHLALGFACRRPEVRAVATIAGVGLWEAIVESSGDLPARLALRCYTNAEDFADLYATELELELASRGRSLDRIERPGDHPFADYAANGSVADAFEFALRALRT